MQWDDGRGGQLERDRRLRVEPAPVGRENPRLTSEVDDGRTVLKLKGVYLHQGVATQLRDCGGHGLLFHIDRAPDGKKPKPLPQPLLETERGVP